jgi:argininosuccinate lyase
MGTYSAFNLESVALVHQPSQSTPNRLWGGMFEAPPQAAFEALHRSIGFDQTLWRYDILGTLAHVDMLAAQGYLTPEELNTLNGGLQQLYAEIDAGTTAINPMAEDIHSFVEDTLTQRLGVVAKKMHLGRSRNDQVALDFRLYVRAELDATITVLKALITALLQQAQAHLHTYMPGFTHLQPAQPITLAHHLLAYAEMFKRDVERLQSQRPRVNHCPLGSGALATTTLNLDRHKVAHTLGFEALCPNSLDAVADRDFAIELVSTLSLSMMHLSRLSEELVLWVNPCFNFVSLDKSLCTGSSMMPQKQNPDAAELIRGKVGRVYGSLTTLLTTLKGLPLAYNKDMQEDKEPVFDAVTTTQGCLDLMRRLIEGLQANKPRMEELALWGYANATDLADYLVRKGIPFRQAHEVVGHVVKRAMAEGLPLEALPLESYHQVHEAFEPDVFESLSLEACVQGRALPGGPAPAACQAHIQALQGFLASL